VFRDRVTDGSTPLTMTLNNSSALILKVFPYCVDHFKVAIALVFITNKKTGEQCTTLLARLHLGFKY
jgi:hypothetical protein